MSGIITRDTSGFFDVKTKYHADGNVEIIKTQDVEAIIEENKRKQNDRNFNNGMTQSGDMKHVASIPLIVWDKWHKDEVLRQGKNIPYYGKEMNEIARKHLNDPDNKFLRTGLGEIGKVKR